MLLLCHKNCAFTAARFPAHTWAVPPTAPRQSIWSRVGSRLAAVSSYLPSFDIAFGRRRSARDLRDFDEFGSPSPLPTTMVVVRDEEGEARRSRRRPSGATIVRDPASRLMSMQI